VQELIDELYDKIESINESIDATDILSECSKLGIEYDEKETSVKDLLRTIVDKLGEILCTEQDEKGFYENDLDISGWDLSTDCYKDDCNPEFKSLSSLLKKITEQQCSNCIKVENLTVDKTFTSPLPDVMIADIGYNEVNITIPVDFCSFLKVKTIGQTIVNINGGSTVSGGITVGGSVGEYADIIYDGTKIIKL
jgi:hypothetical protein